MPEINGLNVELARHYGDRLATIVAETLVQESTVHPAVLAALEGIRDCMPTTPTEWGAFVRQLVKDNEIAQRNLAFSDEKRREALRQEELSSLRPEQRVTLARKGQLDRYLEKRIQDSLGNNE